MPAEEIEKLTNIEVYGALAEEKMSAFSLLK